METPDKPEDLSERMRGKPEPPPSLRESDRLIRQEAHRDPAKLPVAFRRILGDEINKLRLPLATPMYPFKPRRPPAVDNDYIQTGYGDHLFDDLDYAVMQFVFGTSELGRLTRSGLKDWLVNKCGVPLSQLEELSWPDISKFSVSAIEAEYTQMPSDAEDHSGQRATAPGKTSPGLKDAGKGSPKPITTLKAFIQTYCDLSAKPDVQSKVALLHEYNRKGRITLPRLANEYRRGQHKYYLVEDLVENWQEYQKTMPTLPFLKAPGK